MKRKTPSRRLGRSGFTLPEVLVASAVSATVLAVTLGVYINVFRSWHGIELRMQADRDVNMAMSRMVYGMGDRRGIRAARGVTVTNTENGWTLTYPTGVTTPQTNRITYSATTKMIIFDPGEKVLGRDIAFAQVIPQSRSLVVTLRVERAEGSLKVRREIGTEISWRN